MQLWSNITQIVRVLSKYNDRCVDSMFVFRNRCARANLHQQKRALKLCSATLIDPAWSFGIRKVSFKKETDIP